MVKASDINKDIRSIAEKVGVAVFSYDDIHNEGINNEFHYDYERVIAEVSRLQKITPKEAEAQLVKQGILKPLPGGEYEVDVGGTTRGGGGINYGSAFFSLSSKDYQVKYHELAHSLQSEYGLFDDEKLNRLYETAEKGLKDGENKEDKLLDRWDYFLYLNEMHSETFSYAALMLRAENRRDFLWQASQAYKSAIDRNSTAVLSFGKTEYGAGNNNSKFYAIKPVMKPMIKAIWKIRKEGRQGEFFDENGVLKDEKLARLCEEVVMKNAYSPRTLKSFFEYNVLDGHSSQEKGWRGDALKSLVQMPLCMTELLQEGGMQRKIKSIFKHKKLVAEQDKKLKKFVAKRVDYGNPELTALKEYERLQTKIGLVDRKFPGKYIGSRFQHLLPELNKDDLTNCSINHLAGAFMENSAHKKELGKELTKLRQMMKENKGNPYFEKLVQAMPKNNELRQMIQEKQQNPQQEVTAGLVEVENRYGIATYGIRRKVEKISQFAEKYQLDPVVKESLLETMVKNPLALDDMQNREVFISTKTFENDFFGKKQKKYAEEFNKLMDSVVYGHYSNRGNPLYQEALQELSKQPTEMYAEKIAAMEKYEREAVKNKQPVRFADEKPAENPLEPSVKEQVMQTSREQAQETIVKESLAQTQVQEVTAPQPSLSPREQVDAEMAKYGIAKGSYMLFSSEDKNLETGYGTDSLRKVDAYLHNQKEAQEAGTDKIMGQNNGLTAVYFAKEDVYLVTANPEVAEAMKYSGCKDVGLGVMFSNGERIINDATKLTEWQQVRNMGEDIAQKKWEEQRRRDEQVQEVTAPQPSLSPREQVDAEMAKYGIAKGSYMLFSSEDKNLETGYGTDSLRKVDAYLHNQKEAQEAGTDKIMGQNNGLTAVYFAKEDVYLVTANPEVAEAMKYSGCKDVGLGVMFSNGEMLMNDATKLTEWQQVRNMGEDIAKKKWEEQRRRDEQVQKAEAYAPAETAASNSANLKKLLLEKSGRLSTTSSAPVQKNGTSLQVAKLKSASYDR